MDAVAPSSSILYRILRSTHLLLAALILPVGLGHFLSVQGPLPEAAEFPVILFAILAALFVVGVDQISYPVDTPGALLLTGGLIASLGSSAWSQRGTAFGGLVEAGYGLFYVYTIAMVIALGVATAYLAILSFRSPGEKIGWGLTVVYVVLLVVVGSIALVSRGPFLRQWAALPGGLEKAAWSLSCLVQGAAILQNWFHSSVLSKRHGTEESKGQAASFERWIPGICTAILISALLAIFVVVEISASAAAE